MRRLLSTCLPSLALAVSAAANPGLKPGERFEFRVGWGPFSKAGSISVRCEGPRPDSPYERVHIETATRGVVESLFDYENKAILVLAPGTGRILQGTEKGGRGKNASDSTTTFDYAARTATHVDIARPHRNRTIPLHDQDPVDLITFLISTREWEVRPGDKRQASVFFGRDVFPIEITAEAFEEVRTPSGRVKALRLTPRMIGEPRGIFKRGGDIAVWLSEDSPRLPVKLQLHLPFGTAVLLLETYAPPAGP